MAPTHPIYTQRLAQLNHYQDPLCYNLGSSLHKRNDLQGKDGSTSVLRYLTNGSVRMNAEDNISRTRASGSKGQPLMAVAEMGVEDTGSNGYQ